MSFLRRTYLDVISGRSAGTLSDALRGLLRLLTVPYLCGIAVRNLYYDLARWAAYRCGRPVISVGNITVGGTGKTPVAAHVANLLEQRGRRVAVLLRGYMGRPIQFDDEDRDAAASRWRMESDEALVLKRRCPRAEIVVNPKRVAAARYAIEHGADALVLDDGFQHRRMARDLDIVLIDATQPFGHGHLLPRGLLREPTRSLRRANLIVLTRSDQVAPTIRAHLLRKLKQLSDDRPVIQAVHRIAGFTDVKGHPVAVPDPTVMQAVVFAGIANFDSFRNSVKQLGVHVLAAYEYPDHHDYTPQEIESLGDVAAGLEANVILTTEKDAVKLVGRWSDEGCRLLAVGLEIEFDEEGEKTLVEAIDQLLRIKP